jgi:hypothetical protein
MPATDETSAQLRNAIQSLLESLVQSGYPAEVQDRVAAMLVFRAAETDPEAQIRIERRRIYGDPRLNLDATGDAWRGILAQHFGYRPPEIPGEIVALMLAAMKIVRASCTAGAGHADNYIDGRNYIQIARELNGEENALQSDAVSDV